MVTNTANINTFTNESYIQLINLFVRNDYQIVNYTNYHNDGKQLLIRHDVDFSLKKAKALAFLEKKHDIRSTYFILVRSNFYNVWSKESLNHLHEILESGHEIGLHYDEAIYEIESDYDAILDSVIQEKTFLENILKSKIQTISMHRPSKKTLGSDYVFPELVNSYSQHFFKEWKYISDSRMNWRENVYDIIASNQYPRIHLLTHPFWYSNEQETTKEKLMSFLNSARKDRYDYLMDNFRELNEFIQEQEIL